VTPNIEKYLGPLQKTLLVFFKSGRDTFDQHVVMEKLPDNADKRNAALENILSNVQDFVQIKKNANDLLKEQLKGLDTTVFGNIDVNEIRSKLIDLNLTLFDSAIYTVQVRLDQKIPKTKDLKLQILADYDHDAQVAMLEFIFDTATDKLKSEVNKLLKPITDQAIEQFKALIPPEMNDFMDIGEIINTLIKTLVGEAIKLAMGMVSSQVISKVVHEPAHVSNGTSNGNAHASQSHASNASENHASNASQNFTRQTSNRGSQVSQASQHQASNRFIPRPHTSINSSQRSQRSTSSIPPVIIPRQRTSTATTNSRNNLTPMNGGKQPTSSDDVEFTFPLCGHDIQCNCMGTNKTRINNNKPYYEPPADY
jgi:hypothetical protein